MNDTELRKQAQQVRLRALELCYRKKASHLGGAFSIADFLTVLYFKFLNVDPQNPQASDRDRLFYSKGHACTTLYAALEQRGFFKNLPADRNLESYTDNDSIFTSHVNHKVPGVELSTGSLGHALGVAAGVALAAKMRKQNFFTYAILSDGELNEGSNWEAILFAAHHKLNRLILIVDYNKIQSFGRTEEVLNLAPLADKFASFGWNVSEVDGHDLQKIQITLQQVLKCESQKPSVIIAHTVKGKGVSFMEDRLEWHYKSPNDTEYAQAVAELKGAQ